MMSPDATRLFGRELDLPETAVAVRVRSGERALSHEPVDGIAAYLTGLDVIECADLASAVAAAPGTAPGLSLRPYLLCGWLGHGLPLMTGDRALSTQIEQWRATVDGHGLYVMGSSFGGVEGIAALRFRDPSALGNDAPFIEIDGAWACIDIILSHATREAVALAASHPLAAQSVVVVRRFRS